VLFGTQLLISLLSVLSSSPEGGSVGVGLGGLTEHIIYGQPVQ
jgi:hypothetical protein